MNGVRILAVCVLGATSACSTFEGLKLAGSDAGLASNGKAACERATVQPQPTLVSVPGNHDFVVVFRTVDFSPHGGTVGFDLDGKCTGQGEGPGCQRPPWADAVGDGLGGRDNSVPTLYTDTDAGADSASRQVNFSIDSGQLTTALRVRGYNDAPNDFDVDVEFFGATRASGDLNTDPNRPAWDGADAWNPLIDWTEPAGDGSAGFRSPYRSDRAYVTDGVLVAHFAAVVAATDYRFSNAYIQARLDRDASGNRILEEGTFAGRLRVDQMLSGLGYLFDTTVQEPTRLCTDAPGYPMSKQGICALADIRYDDDNTSLPCDGASWAYRFETGAALLSDTVNQTALSKYPYCPDATSPRNDHCDPHAGSP
jgi:hypothetical protein